MHKKSIDFSAFGRRSGVKPCHLRHGSNGPRAIGRSRGLTVGSSIRYAADFLPLTINASAGKLIVPLTKYLRAASATACFMVGS